MSAAYIEIEDLLSLKHQNFQMGAIARKDKQIEGLTKLDITETKDIQFI